MRSLRRQAIAACASLLALGGSASAQVKDYHEIKTPALRQVALPQAKRIALPNGMIVFLMEDHELPLIRGSARIRGGARDVSAAKTGLTGIYGAAWRTGGTTSKTGDQLDELLESKAARVETGGGIDSTNISMDVLKDDFDSVFPIFVDLLRNPAFRQDKIDLAKTQANTGISRRNDEPGGIIGREAGKLGYGPDSPYARQTEYATIAAITRDDLLAFHKKFVYPNNIILGFVGDFDSAKIEKQLRTTFGSWAKGPQAPKAEDAPKPAKPGLYFIAKDDVTQSNIALVHTGTTRNNPDYYAINVMNEILSGGFSGRLMLRLRSQRGLTYGVGGGLGADWDHQGLFRVQMATKSGTTLEALDALKKEISLLTTADFTPEELSLAKESILNSFVFTMDSRGKILNQQMQLEFYGFPLDYFQKFPSQIEKVTATDVARVAKKYVHPNDVAVLIVGKESDFEKPLASLGGTVTPIDITIPEPPSTEKKSAAAAPPSANSAAEGKALVNKVADFFGGKAKIDAVQAMHATGSLNMSTPNGPMEAEVESTLRYPDAQRVVMKMPMGEIVTVAAPTGAFMITPMGTQDMPGSQKDAALADLKTDTIAVLKNIDNPKYTFNAAGTEKVGDVEGRVIEINADGATLKWIVDPSNGKLLRKITRGRGPMPGDQAVDYGEWKTFGGINFPVSATITRGTEKAGDVKTATVEFNPKIDPSLFVKP